MLEVKTQYGNKAKVIAWYILKNGWEYYQLEEFDEYGHAYGFVMGDCNEFGSFNINEIKPYLWGQAHGDELNEIALPPEWVRLGMPEWTELSASTFSMAPPDRLS